MLQQCLGVYDSALVQQKRHSDRVYSPSTVSFAGSVECEAGRIESAIGELPVVRHGWLFLVGDVVVLARIEGIAAGDIAVERGISSNERNITCAECLQHTHSRPRRIAPARRRA